jgi:hypothetical protein
MARGAAARAFDADGPASPCAAASSARPRATRLAAARPPPRLALPPRPALARFVRASWALQGAVRSARCGVCRHSRPAGRRTGRPERGGGVVGWRARPPPRQRRLIAGGAIQGTLRRRAVGWQGCSAPAPRWGAAGRARTGVATGGAAGGMRWWNIQGSGGRVGALPRRDGGARVVQAGGNKGGDQGRAWQSGARRGGSAAAGTAPTSAGLWRGTGLGAGGTAKKGTVRRRAGSGAARQRAALAGGRLGGRHQEGALRPKGGARRTGAGVARWGAARGARPGTLRGVRAGPRTGASGWGEGRGPWWGRGL